MTSQRQQRRTNRAEANLTEVNLAEVRHSDTGVARDAQGRVLLNSEGEVTERGELYPFHVLDPWRQGVQIKGNREVAVLKTGREVTLARTVRGTREVTRMGRSYFRNRRVQWMVNVPASKAVLEDVDEGRPRAAQSSRGNARQWDTRYTILDQTLQTYYN